MVISAKRGDHDKGYVALDDFFFEATPADSCHIYPIDAEPTSSTTWTSSADPSPFPDCDFETNYCDWHVDEELNGTQLFIFIRTSGNLHHGGDGPEHDHTDNENSNDSKPAVSYYRIIPQLSSSGQMRSLARPDRRRPYPAM